MYAVFTAFIALICTENTSGLILIHINSVLLHIKTKYNYSTPLELMSTFILKFLREFMHFLTLIFASIKDNTL